MKRHWTADEKKEKGTKEWWTSSHIPLSFAVNKCTDLENRRDGSGGDRATRTSLCIRMRLKYTN